MPRAATADIVLPGGAPAAWPAAARAALSPCFQSSYAACAANPAHAGKLLADWNATILRRLAPAMAASSANGFFVNSCYRHHNIDGASAFDTKVSVDGRGDVSLVDAVASWVLGLDGPTKVLDPRPPFKCP